MEDSSPELRAPSSVNLAVEFAGIRMHNPVASASGTFGYAKEFEPYLDLNQLGAVVVKTITRLPVPWGKGTVLGAVVMMQSVPKAVIAAINGPAVGLGFSLALACDMRIASDRARFSAVFVKRGVGPDTGVSFTLPRVVGFPKACEMMLTGDMIDAAEAERIGVVNKVVPHDQLMTATTELAEKIAKNPPLAVAAHKEALYKSMSENDIIEQLKLEVVIQDKLLITVDFKEAAAAFLEKRPAVFKGK